jgi:ketosteroid isomerase-like protein
VNAAEKVKVEVSAESDRKAVTAAVEAFGAALNRGDYAAAVEMMTGDAVYWPDASPEIGKADSLAAYDRLAAYRVKASFPIKEILVSGDLALVIAHEYFRLEPKAGGAAIEINGRRAFSVWQRQADGRWKSSRGMTNWPAPQTPPTR